MSNNGKKNATAASGTKKPSKQGNLFSFFSKKEKQSSSTVPLQQPTASVPLSHNTASSKSPTPLNQASPKNLQSVSQNSSFGQILSHQVKIGDFVEVYWVDDHEWYKAKVMKKKQATSTYFIQYSIDGQSEWIDLSTESFRLLDGHAKISEKRCSRTVDDDLDSGSDEAEFVPSSFDDEAEYTGTEDDQWMVTDDEDEIAPKKKQKINSKLAVGTTDSKGQRKQKQAKKKNISAKSSLSQYAAPMIVTQHSVSGNGKKTPSNTHVNLKTPQHITPMTFASGEISAKGNFTFCSNTVEKSCKEDVVTPLAVSKSLSKPPKRNEIQQAPNFEVGALNPAGSHVHNHLPFLQHPRDYNGRTLDDPNYDSRTLQIQERDWVRIVGKKMTDAVKQWWDLKAMYFDTVLLFKTGTLQYQFPACLNVLQKKSPHTSRVCARCSRQENFMKCFTWMLTSVSRYVVYLT
jgi:hypothetical protein